MADLSEVLAASFDRSSQLQNPEEVQTRKLHAAKVYWPHARKITAWQ